MKSDDSLWFRNVREVEVSKGKWPLDLFVLIQVRAVGFCKSFRVGGDKSWKIMSEGNVCSWLGNDKYSVLLMGLNNDVGNADLDLGGEWAVR